MEAIKAFQPPPTATPDRTGCTLFGSIDTPRKIANLDTAAVTTLLSVKVWQICPPREE